MSPEEFTNCVAKEKDDLLAMCMNPDSGSAVAAEIAALGLTPDKSTALKKVLNEVLTDAYYSFLMALDGAGSLGEQQRDFELRDEDGTLLTKGELEGPAWEAFHGSSTT